MRNYISIQLKHTDPDTGEENYVSVANISTQFPEFKNSIISKLNADIYNSGDGNAEIVEIEHDSHPDAEKSLMNCFALGEQTTHLISYIPNDQDLGKAVRAQYYEIQEAGK